jgi:hypothetical protein
MEKVINGLVYDTDKAEKIASYSNSKSRNDFRFLREELYKTKSGRYFIYGEGGPKTKYSKPVNGGRSGSHDIRAVSENDAVAWLEKHNKVDVIREEFPDHLEPA